MKATTSNERVEGFAEIIKQRGDIIELTVFGSSMSPTLERGGRIRVRCIDRPDYHRGQVVTFRIGNRLVTHRIVHHGHVGSARNWLLARGDGRMLIDPPIASSEVIGVATHSLCRDQWCDIGPAPKQALHRRIIATMIAWVVALAMELHPSLGKATRAAVGRLGRAGWHSAPRVP